MSMVEIDKEEIANYKLIPADYDRTIDLLSSLESAQRLGNEFKAKTTIAFMTAEGIKKVTTTVWSLTENHIQLKAGVLIPLRSIVEVSY